MFITFFLVETLPVPHQVEQEKGKGWKAQWVVSQVSPTETPRIMLGLQSCACWANGEGPM